MNEVLEKSESFENCWKQALTTKFGITGSKILKLNKKRDERLQAAQKPENGYEQLRQKWQNKKNDNDINNENDNKIRNNSFVMRLHAIIIKTNTKTDSFFAFGVLRSPLEKIQNSITN